MPTAAYQAFRQSMNIGYDQWHDGTSYDMAAFAEMAAAERDVIVREMLDKPRLDWRDMEVLAAVNSREAFDRLRDLIDRRESAQTYGHALRHLIDMPGRMSGRVPDAKLRDLLERVTDNDGLTTALQIAKQHAGPWSKLALLRGVQDRPDVAIHFAGTLLDLAGVSGDMAVFDPKFRPTLLNLLPDSSPTDRAAAFEKVCEWLGVDPLTIPPRGDGGRDTAWAEKTWKF
jgi:DNA-binding TFAR19-related protein (PDSD5 family)